MKAMARRDGMGNVTIIFGDGLELFLQGDDAEKFWQDARGNDWSEIDVPGHLADEYYPSARDLAVAENKTVKELSFIKTDLEGANDLISTIPDALTVHVGGTYIVALPESSLNEAMSELGYSAMILPVYSHPYPSPTKAYLHIEDGRKRVFARTGDVPFRYIKFPYSRLKDHLLLGTGRVYIRFVF